MVKKEDKPVSIGVSWKNRETKPIPSREKKMLYTRSFKGEEGSKKVRMRKKSRNGPCRNDHKRSCMRSRQDPGTRMDPALSVRTQSVRESSDEFFPCTGSRLTHVKGLTERGVLPRKYMSSLSSDPPDRIPGPSVPRLPLSVLKADADSHFIPQRRI